MADEAQQRRKVLSYFRPDALEGRVALVTGGGSGIGFEIARQFGKHGAAGVVIMGRRRQFLDEAVKLLQEEGVRAAACTGDVRKPEDCDAAVKETVKTFGALDILVNCAAGNFLATAEGLSPNGFKTVMEIDTLGSYNMAHFAFEPLRRSKFGGVVTSITATLHYTATWYQTAPVAAKAAIDVMMRNMALEWGEFGIRCNTIAPGPIEDTPGLEKLSGGAASRGTMQFPSIPARRAGTKAEIASACIYLCLNEYITGHGLVVDGGDWFGKVAYMPREAIARISRSVEKGSRQMGPASKL
uniref:2,4-dienoyl-CoA reductase [(3E)-enoyl-CoA-producing] n=1 Tax=Alexandrium andersonii TaxID=327968 RepID=A0A7S2NIH2_9DINO|mmetsp:Transcript_96756/g.216795  ORF Transcript_96756/g.216795 Transcript_96756/m.216795 type:complete len:299 (+) Transcript_96756:3-899(+)